jgi:transcriptional regulator with XRE-family HTH domain
MSEHERGEGAGASEYARIVGARLRSIRRQKRLSLQEVEARSGQEFKASVLGAYERGERAISVPRLQRLARFYRVPVDQLLPADDGPDFGPRPGDADVVVGLTDRGRVEERPIKIDLSAIEGMSGQQGELLARYFRMIQVQRGDFNGRVLTVRRDDLRAIACILDTTLESAFDALTSFGLILRKTQSASSA